jgi:hypothetical protein
MTVEPRRAAHICSQVRLVLTANSMPMTLSPAFIPMTP